MSVSDADMVDFRVAGPDDLPRVIELLDDVAGEPQTAWFRDLVDRAERDPASALFVGFLHRSVVCCAQVSLSSSLEHGGVSARIDASRVTVHPMRRGIGHALVAFCIEQARSAGAGVIEVSVASDDPDTERFYAELGFERSCDRMTRRV